MRSPAVQSRPVYERPGYRTLLGRIRENVRTYIRKQLELPRQELAEIIRANVGAAKWFGVALVFVFAFLTALVVLIIALIALVLPLWASALIVLAVMGLGAGINVRKAPLKQSEPEWSATLSGPIRHARPNRIP